MFFHIISRVGQKFPWLRNDIRLINNKNTSPIQCVGQVFLYSMVFYVNIWTGMASNNTISWSATYDSILTYFRREHGLASQIHHVHVSTSRWSMSISGTQQNIRFNVLVLPVCSIYGENNIWHVKFWRFTLEVEVVFQTALYHTGSLVVSNFAYLG